MHFDRDLGEKQGQEGKDSRLDEPDKDLESEKGHGENVRPRASSEISSITPTKNAIGDAAVMNFAPYFTMPIVATPKNSIVKKAMSARASVKLRSVAGE